VFVGVHVEANVGRIALCAEAVALGAALSAGARGVETIVAVAHPAAHQARGEAWVVAPCGMCSELLSDFGPDAWVILPSADGSLVKVGVLDLLPASTRVSARSERSGARSSGETSLIESQALSEVEPACG
jgi:cytidine deaminase